MIVQLMREQARAHRAYLMWTAALLTLAIAMAAFAAFSAAQQAAVHRHAAHAYGLDGPWVRAVKVDATSPSSDTMTLGDLEESLATADSEGAQIAVSHLLDGVSLARETSGAITAEDAWWGNGLGTRGVRGALHWDELLLDGTPPADGEIVLNTAAARAVGAGIGDRVTMVAERWDSSSAPRFAPLATLTVSGLMREGTSEGFTLNVHDALVSWDTSLDLSDAATEATGSIGRGQYIDVSAQRETPALATVRGWEGTPWFGGNGGGVLLTLLAVSAAVLVIGLIGMAFAVGRSQAQARTQWVATARVLGARRRSIVAATVGEVTLLGLAAGVLGTGLAAGALWLEWNAFAGAHPDALLPAGLDLPRWLILALGGLGVVIAAIMGAIPAFWAARVSPSAALKPVSPVTQAELSRRISPAWIYGMWAASVAGLLAVRHASPTGNYWMVALATLALSAVVVTVAALVELNRALVTWTGSLLARSRRPWALATGDALLGHLRQAAVPAAVFTIAMTALSAIATWSALYAWQWHFPGDWEWTGTAGWPHLPAWLAVPGEQSPGGMAGGPRLAIGALSAAVLVLVALASFASTTLATREEDEARRALGLHATAARVATGLRFGLPLAIGSLVGTCIGVALVVASFQGEAAVYSLAGDLSGPVPTEPVGPVWAATRLGHAVVPVGVSLLATLACVALGSVAAALMLRVNSAEGARVKTGV